MIKLLLQMSELCSLIRFDVVNRVCEVLISSIIYQLRQKNNLDIKEIKRVSVCDYLQILSGTEKKEVGIYACIEFSNEKDGIITSCVSFSQDYIGDKINNKQKTMIIKTIAKQCETKLKLRVKQLSPFAEDDTIPVMLMAENHKA